MSKQNCFSALDFRTNKPISITTFDGKITAIKKNKDLENTSYFMAPGLVDLQINGFKGIDFNDLALTENDVHKVCEILLTKGITRFFPTIITNSSEAIQKLLKTIITACKNSELTNSCIAGIHLEGPFISDEDGPRGAHNKQFVQKPNWELFTKWQQIANGKIKIITLSPEWKNCEDFIKKCTATNVKVAIGHTAAKTTQINTAIHAGATLSTHLGNGCHALLPRHKNYIFEQLASNKLWSTLIADGFHLPDALLKIFIKAKPNKSILVSDATSFAGLPAGDYQSHIGGAVTLNSDGKLHLKDNPNLLAGSAQSLFWCVNQIVSKEIISLKTAWKMASTKPIKAVFGKVDNSLKVGNKADLVIFKKMNNTLEIQKTIKDGKIVFSSDDKI